MLPGSIIFNLSRVCGAIVGHFTVNKQAQKTEKVGFYQSISFTHQVPFSAPVTINNYDQLLPHTE